MVLFCTWFAWILHGNRKLQWRVREHRTRGWQPAAAAGDFRLRSVPPVKLAISSLCWNRSFDWRFQTGYEPRVAGVCRTCRTGFFDFLGLGESCHLVWRFAHKEIAHSNGDLHLLSVYKTCSVFIKLTTIWVLRVSVPSSQVFKTYHHLNYQSSRFESPNQALLASILLKVQALLASFKFAQYFVELIFL